VPQSATKKKKKKETTAKHKPTWNYRSGWPNQELYIMGKSSNVIKTKVKT